MYLKEARLTLILSLPFIFNQILQMSVLTIDSVMAGNESDLTLAAVSQGTTLFHIVILCLLGCLMPLLAMFARLHAGGNEQSVRDLFQQSLWLALPLGIIGFVVMRFIPNAFHWIGVKPEIIGPATDYVHIVSYSVPFVTMLLPMRFFIEGIGKPYVVMMFTAAVIPINVIGNYVFLNGLFGLPKMGVFGLGLATLIANLYLFVIVALYLFKSKKMRALNLFYQFSLPKLNVIKSILKIGIPSSVMLLMETGMFTVMVLVSGTLGVTESAANQIMLNYVSNIFMIPLGMSMAITSRIGSTMAEGNMNRVRAIGLTGIALSATFMSISGFVTYSFGDGIAGLYTDNVDILSITVTVLLVAVFFQIFDGIQVSTIGALRGMEITTAPMIYAVIGYWLIGTPCAVVLTYIFDFGVVGLWCGIALGLTITAILSLRNFLNVTKT